MADEFQRAVEDGLNLSKRIYFGKDPAVIAPKQPLITSADHSYLPAGPMIYAVISNPGIVDNPDITSYQPHVHGRCDPPVLIPLQMNGIELEVDCYLDTAFVRLSGSWRLHCVMASKKCNCRIALPMGEQGSILDVGVEVLSKWYRTELIAVKDSDKETETANPADGVYLKPNIFTLTIPEIDGGSVMSVRISWSQKLVYSNGEFSLNIPFTFPEYVVPVGLKMSKKERIELNMNTGTGFHVMHNTTSHRMKELRRLENKLAFLYEADVYSWSSTDFNFSYTVSPSDIQGAVYLQSPSAQDFDQREMFCVYLFPGNQQSRKVFRKAIVFVVDISESMLGKPLDATKKVLSGALFKLDEEDLFSIIAFNGEACVFSTSMESATKEAIQKAVEWMSVNFIAGGGTNIMAPLNQAMEMLSNCDGSNPIIFLITDGAVETERQICQKMEQHVMDRQTRCPRIYTFGIGLFCNHYFLRMLATMSRGQYEAAYDVDAMEVRLEKLATKASSIILSNITLDALDDLDEIEVFPDHIPDLSSASPFIISGRYHGKFPSTFEAKGVLANLSPFIIDLKIYNAKDMPLDKVIAREQIELLASRAWFSENKQLWDKIVKLSIQTGAVSEHTRMVILGGKEIKETYGLNQVQKKSQLSKTVESECQTLMVLKNLCVGFGNLKATADNIPPGWEEPKLQEEAQLLAKAASYCCGSMCDHCCCMCCIQSCTRISDPFAIVLTQLCTALACIGCFSCCQFLCCCWSSCSYHERSRLQLIFKKFCQ